MLSRTSLRTWRSCLEPHETRPRAARLVLPPNVHRTLRRDGESAREVASRTRATPETEYGAPLRHEELLRAQSAEILSRVDLYPKLEERHCPRRLVCDTLGARRSILSCDLRGGVDRCFGAFRRFAWSPWFWRFCSCPTHAKESGVITQEEQRRNGSRHDLYTHSTAHQLEYCELSRAELRLLR